MKKIQLITFSNKRYKEALSKSELILAEYPQPLNRSALTSIQADRSCDYTIFEPDSNDPEHTKNILSLTGTTSRVICVIDTITEKLKKLFLQYGISDVIQGNDIKRLLAYLKIIDKETPISSGNILILERNKAKSQILQSIISRFGYTAVFCHTLESLFENIMKPNNQMVLLNIGTENLDLNALIRQSYSHRELKKLPVIAYKDMDVGLFVHELISGLNRLTKFILSPDELYSFLIDILFRKEIIPVVGIINKSVNYEGESFYSYEPLQRIFHTNENTIFSLDNLLHEDNIEGMLHLTTLFKKTIIKADGFKWMRMKNIPANTKVCGVCG